MSTNIRGEMKAVTMPETPSLLEFSLLEKMVKAMNLGSSEVRQTFKLIQLYDADFENTIENS